MANPIASYNKEDFMRTQNEYIDGDSSLTDDRGHFKQEGLSKNTKTRSHDAVKGASSEKSPGNQTEHQLGTKSRRASNKLSGASLRTSRTVTSSSTTSSPTDSDIEASAKNYKSEEKADAGLDAEDSKNPRKRKKRQSISSESDIEDFGTSAKTKRSKELGKAQASEQNKGSDQATLESKDMKLFSGLKFSFVPPNLQVAVNKHRVKVFQQHGAKVLETFDRASTTHVLVQPKWSGSKVLKTLNVDHIPSSINVVYNSWPSDCISANKLVDLAKYQVPGLSKEPNNDKKEPVDQERHSASEATAPVIESDDDLTKIINDDKALDIETASDEEADIYDFYSKKTNTNSWKSQYVDIPDAVVGKDNPNKMVISAFSQILAHYEAVKDTWKMKAYRIAINSLSKCKKPVTTAEEAKKLPGFGGKLADHLEEIVKTGHFSKLDYLQKHDKQAKVISMLLKIYGVGPVIARKWYQEGVRTLDDVRKRNDLSAAQKIGLEHYDDFAEYIPREEVSKHFEIVKKALADISEDMQVYCMGSYRRGSKLCGDIDIVMTKPGVKEHELTRVLYRLLNKLSEMGFSKCTLAGQGANDMRWLGATALTDESPWRRMDILLVPANVLGANLIYYTGDDLFNRKMRFLAKQKGYRLSNNGLFARRNDGKGGETFDLLADSASEKKIFDILGVTYRPPEKRAIGLVKRGVDRSELEK